MPIDELDAAKLQEVLSSETRGVLVDFWSTWCAPCRALRPQLDKMAEKHLAEWRFVAINSETHPAVAEAHDVRSLPTLILFRDEEEIFRFSGGVLPSSVAEKLNELGNTA